MLGRYASERVLVAREGVSPVVQVKKVIEDFIKASFAFQGVVLNGFIPRNANKKLAYGYQAAAKGYRYGGDGGSGNDRSRPEEKGRPGGDQAGQPTGLSRGSIAARVSSRWIP